jgi:hypothetical protein
MSWTRLPWILVCSARRLPQAVRYPPVAVSGGDIYLFGGLLSGGEYTRTFTR